MSPAWVHRHRMELPAVVVLVAELGVGADGAKMDHALSEEIMDVKFVSIFS